jgi:hypothetical protein
MENITMMKSIRFQGFLKYDVSWLITRPNDMILIIDSIVNKIVVTKST